MAVKVVQDDGRCGGAAELDDDAHALAVRFVPHLRSAVQLSLFDQIGYACHEVGLIDLVRNLRKNEAFTFLATHVLDLMMGLHDYPAATCGAGVSYAFHPPYVRSGREVRSLHELHEVVDGGIGVRYQVSDGVTHFAQVVGGYVRGHAHCDAGRSVDEQVGQSRRQYGGFLE